MQFQPNMGQIARLINRRMQLAFFVGLILGIIIGWVLSPIVGWVVRIGVVALLLVPLVLAILFWIRVRKANSEGSATIITWGSSSLPPTDDDPFGFRREARPGMTDDDIIDIEDIERELRS